MYVYPILFLREIVSKNKIKIVSKNKIWNAWIAMEMIKLFKLKL